MTWWVCHIDTVRRQVTITTITASAPWPAAVTRPAGRRAAVICLSCYPTPVLQHSVSTGHRLHHVCYSDIAGVTKECNSATVEVSFLTCVWGSVRLSISKMILKVIGFRILASLNLSWLFYTFFIGGLFLHVDLQYLTVYWDSSNNRLLKHRGVTAAIGSYAQWGKAVWSDDAVLRSSRFRLIINLLSLYAIVLITNDQLIKLVKVCEFWKHYYHRGI